MPGRETRYGQVRQHTPAKPIRVAWSRFHTVIQSKRGSGLISRVLETPPADPRIANEHFASKLKYETDPSDVHTDLTNEVDDIIVIDARSH